MRFPRSTNFNLNFNPRKVILPIPSQTRAWPGTIRVARFLRRSVQLAIEPEIEICPGDRVSVPTYDGEYRVVVP